MPPCFATNPPSTEQGVWTLTGDPTEGALLPFAAKAGLSTEADTAALPRTNMIPFESEHKFMATLHDSLPFVKGAPDVIMNYCDRQELSGGTQAPLDRALSGKRKTRKLPAKARGCWHWLG